MLALGGGEFYAPATVSSEKEPKLNIVRKLYEARAELGAVEKR